MIEIEVNPCVLAALDAAFPERVKGVYSNTRHLNVYKETLEDLLNKSELYEITPFDYKFNTYTIPLQILNSKPQITIKNDQMVSSKIRLSTWLTQNNLSLIKEVRKGKKVGPNTGLSIIEPNKLATINIIDERIQPAKAFKKLHPSFPTCPLEIERDYDCSPVDMDSLNNYIDALINNGRKLNNKEKSATIQAKRVVAAAMAKNGLYYQKKKYSDFGRIYYSGLSVQNISKKTREAMLGDCYEYDMKSSVVAWKLGYAQTYLNKHHLTHSVKDEFPQCYQYWDDKSVLIDDIRKAVFIYPCARYKSDEKQIKLIKQALTAFNFGARRSSGYTDKMGVTQEQAIGKILKHKLECASFLGHPRVMGFVDEQRRLNEIIKDLVKTNNPQLLTNSILLTDKGNLRPQSLMSYLYQHAETFAMNIVRDNAKAHNLLVIANIHDAIVFKDPLNPTLKQQITQDIHAQTGNTYWELGVTKLNRTN